METGTPRAEVLAKAGNLPFAISSSDHEMLSYSTAEGGSVRIRVVDERFAKIEQTLHPPDSEAQSASTGDPAIAVPPVPD